ncbi:TonB-dependent receptor [Olivibacter sitiensis]|uniref:TonB-dependent receptor n=1 Tax=Olivibacter sitiensis TaxID=376470 RepID=UPI00048918CD|nr:TonB-dependent receptor [Olivibacter sitiensis]
MRSKIILTFLTLLFGTMVMAQTGTMRGSVRDVKGEAIAYATVSIPKLKLGTSADSTGKYELADIPLGTWQVQVSYMGYDSYFTAIAVSNALPIERDFTLNIGDASLGEVVITGTMKDVSRLASPIPVEVYTPSYFRKNPTPSLFDAVGMINGVQPQLNCNVCNTGDIHINGMEGPYTMILIDGMPIVSALSSVYGLSGIPNSMVERIEVVKGPASSLYGSEAMGGIINVITKNPLSAPMLSADVFGTSWGEINADVGTKFNIGNATGLLGVNYFNYKNKVDNNDDNFTDMTLQDRISVFNKWNFRRKENRVASIAARYVYEDRWGGEMNWNKSFRGSDEVYGESIYTKRAELIGLYQLPVKERIFTQFSYNWHDQNSYYGDVPYMATQRVAFAQAYWDKQIGANHDFLLGVAMRYTTYDDNTPATASADGSKNEVAKTPLPGIFVQDEWTLNDKNTVLLGYRYDHDKNHGNVHSPRFAYKFSPNNNNTLRASFGTGFRVVNLFTEDHAALTGSREVVIAEELNPERSYNGNLNYVLKIPTESFFLGFDITGFYSYFTNKIIGDYDVDPNQIVYDNLSGHAVSRGVSLNTDLTFTFPLKVLAGISYMNVYQMREDDLGVKEKVVQWHAPKWSGTFVASYAFPKGFSADFTGQWNGPMRLPIQPNDYRPEYSPWFCVANVQVTKKFDKGIEIYGGVKNLFNFIPKYPLMRPFDPFDRTVDDPVNNPYGWTFDTEYNYASLQGIRGFLGIRYNLF